MMANTLEATTEDVKVLNFSAPTDVIMELTRKIYENNFYLIWMREVLQNSTDALCKSLHISNSYDRETNTTQLIAKDDGMGMTEDIIHNAFLALGGSQKDNDLAVGGFGIAKTIVLGGDAKGYSPYSIFPVYWYVITTGVDEKGV